MSCCSIGRHAFASNNKLLLQSALLHLFLAVSVILVRAPVHCLALHCISVCEALTVAEAIDTAVLNLHLNYHH